MSTSLPPEFIEINCPQHGMMAIRAAWIGMVMHGKKTTNCRALVMEYGWMELNEKYDDLLKKIKDAKV